MGQLRVAAGAAEAARRDREAALQAARELLTAPPDVLDQAEQVGVDGSAAMLAWRQWAEGPADDDPEALATHLERRLDPLDAALERTGASARELLDRKESQWRPVARDLAEWVGSARRAQNGFRSVPDLKAAEQWMKKTSGELRNQRFQPIAEEAQRIWELLRQQSNVELERPELEGTATRRRVKLAVTVDGSVVEKRDPVGCYIEDAWVIAKDEELPLEVAARLVPGFCRGAIEAACTEVVRRRRLGRGEPYAAVDDLLLELTAMQRAALALFDDQGRAGDVYGRLKQQFGRWAVDTFRAVNEGAHGKYEGDLPNLIRDADSLTKKLRALQ
jgi:hypothetical protein